MIDVVTYRKEISRFLSSFSAIVIYYCSSLGPLNDGCLKLLGLGILAVLSLLLILKFYSVLLSHCGTLKL
jgi:hypothetical protein